MAWTVYNTTANSINVTDIAIPQEIGPFSSAQFEVADFLSSRILAETIATGGLCVTSYGDFMPSNGWMPVTFPVHPLGQEIQNGQSPPYSIAPFSGGMLYLNITAINGSLSISWQPFDGEAYYPAVSLVDAVTGVTQTVQPFTQQGIAGRFIWTVSGSVTFSLKLQMR